MRYLLDTHAWLWFLDSPEMIPPRTLALLKDMRNAPLAVSAITPWEVSKKHSLGKLSLSQPLAEWMRTATSEVGINVLPLSPEIAVEANQLPGTFHNDPADQIIVATARVHRLQLVTKDRLLRNYPHVRVCWGSKG